MKHLFRKTAESIQTEGTEIVREAMAQMENSAAEQPREQKRRVPLTHRLGVKITAFLLVFVMAALTIASAVGAVAMIGMEFYTTPEQKFREDIFRNLAEDAASTVLHNVLNGWEQEAKDYCRYKNIAKIVIKSDGERDVNWNFVSSASDNQQTVYKSAWLYLNGGEIIRDYGYYSQAELEEMNAEGFVAEVCIPHELKQEDEFLLADRLISAAYALRYWIFAIAVAAFACAITSFVFLMCASGRKKDFAEPQPGWGTWVPLDVLTVGAMLAGGIVLGLCDDAPYFYSAIKRILAYVCCALALLLIAIGWCMSFALRVKLGKWWKNTLVYRTVSLVGRIIRFLCGLCRTLLGSLPLVWKTAAIYLGIAFVDAVVSFCSWAEYDNLLIWLFVKNLVLFPAVLFIALMLRRLQAGAHALAEGNLEQGMDTAHFFGEFRRTAEDLGSIGDGIAAAVEQRIRSERMKTELITNVSHDLKTPLTSIINYADLIGKEPVGSEKITEYAEVLHRQSERLKRLVDDLVEASRASTGDMEMKPEACELGVMLTQAAGEYGERLEKSRLQLVLRQPESEVRIMADGRRLWRVFDNLMGNICKYAQPDTRVYLTLEERGGRALISFKNTSREALDLGAEELMERFVRGDRSRNSEGNGLGLSIARSLTQLQNGELELTVDGDLFKVVLSFPVIR